MRKIGYILLLILLFLQTTGYMLLFKTQQSLIRQEIKHRIKAGVPEAELVLIDLPSKQYGKSNANIQWIHSHEFRYQGRMYDIVRKESFGNHIRCY